jgi:hypothetical protein
MWDWGSIYMPPIPRFEKTSVPLINKQQLPLLSTSNQSQQSTYTFKLLVSTSIFKSYIFKMVQLSMIAIVLTSALSSLVAANSCKSGGIYCGYGLMARGRL